MARKSPRPTGKALRPKKPRSMDELVSRVRKAHYHEVASRSREHRIDDLRAHLAYESTVGRGHPSESEAEAELLRRRRKLSDRVQRFYRRSGRITLVADLIRRSPVFLSETWVVDLLVDLRARAQASPTETERQDALTDLEVLAQAIVEERIPSGQYRRSRKYRHLQTKRRWDPAATDALQLVAGYNRYLEIAICLSSFREIIAAELTDATDRGRVPVDDALTRLEAKYAEEMTIPAEWIQQLRRRNEKPHLWAKRRVAEIAGTTVSHLPHVLKHASGAMDTARQEWELLWDVGERLRKDRSRKAIERIKAGGTGIHRRY